MRSIKRIVAPLILFVTVLGLQALPADALSNPIQTVSGTIKKGASSAESARKAWLRSNGTSNGGTGYVCAVDSATVGGDFEVTGANPDSTASLRITFYSDIQIGAVCASYTTNTGDPCGSYAIVWFVRGGGANLSFVYQASAGTAAPGWQPPPGSTPETGTYLYLASDTGDYIGQGQTYLYTLADALIPVTQSGLNLSFPIEGDESWGATFAAPNSLTRPEAGYYPNLTRYPFHDPAVGGFSFSGEGRGCNTLTAWVIVDSITYVGGELEDVTLRFEQHCEGGTPALRGKLHWNANDTPPPPDPEPAPAWQPPPGSTPETGTYLYLASDPGDYIGQGQSYLYTLADSLIDVTHNGGLVHLNLSGDEGWTADFKLPQDYSEAQVGYFPDLQRYPFHNPVKGGLSFFGEGRGCNTLTGWFVIDSIAYEAGALQDITLRFEQHCEGATPALRGKLHWNAADGPLPPPDPGPPPAWQPPPGSTPETGTYVYLASDPGDYIGQGLTYLYTAPSEITVTQNAGLISLGINSGTADWTGSFKVPQSYSKAEAGYYPDLQRYPFHNPVKGGLSFSGNGRGCNTLSGWFVIDSISYARNNVLQEVTLRFEQHCEGGAPALRGKLHWVP